MFFFHFFFRGVDEEVRVKGGDWLAEEGGKSEDRHVDEKVPVKGGMEMHWLEKRGCYF